MIRNSVRALILSLLFVGSGASAQSPAPAAPQPAQLQTRGDPNAQRQLLDWQRERADEYYRRLREYVQSLASMA